MLLPDGRLQTVTYRVSGDSGYQVTVSYTQQHPPPPPSRIGKALTSQPETSDLTPSSSTLVLGPPSKHRDGKVLPTGPGANGQEPWTTGISQAGLGSDPWAGEVAQGAGGPGGAGGPPEGGRS